MIKEVKVTMRLEGYVNISYEIDDSLPLEPQLELVRAKAKKQFSNRKYGSLTGVESTYISTQNEKGITLHTAWQDGINHTIKELKNNF